MLLEILIAVVSFSSCVYLYLVHHFGYWERKGVPGYRGSTVLATLREHLAGKIPHLGALHARWYQEQKAKGHKYFGNWNFFQPALFLVDLDLCKQVLTKDFHHFVTRDFAPTSHEYISKHLFSLEGQEWRTMRVKLTPTFTSGKIKNMFYLMRVCAQQLQDHIEDEVLQQEVFQVKDLLTRFTTDVIATCAFGLETNSIKDPNNNFYKLGLTVFDFSRTTVLKFLTIKFFPQLSEKMNLNIFDPRVTQLLSHLIKDTMEFRKKNNVVRNDFVDLLMRIRENKSLEDEEEEGTFKPKKTSQETGVPEKDGLTLEEMTAQAFVFFVAGFETSSSVTSFCMYELSHHTEVQERLRGEIDEVLYKHGGEITYQTLQEMTYMDQVINETLRRYASLAVLTRVCTEPYRVPGTDLVIDKGVRVNIPTYAIHHDPEIYPEPYKFDPERFSEHNSQGRHHYAFLPFGEGPRNCIGMRFGRLQVKIGLVAILSRYQLTLAPDTPSLLEINPYTPVTMTTQPFNLRISRRSDIVTLT